MMHFRLNSNKPFIRISSWDNNYNKLNNKINKVKKLSKKLHLNAYNFKQRMITRTKS